MPHRKVRLGFVQWNDPFDRKASSGTPYKMAEALRSVGYDVIWVRARKSLSYRIYSKMAAFLNRISKAKVKPTHTFVGASLLSKSLDKTAIESCDVLFAPFSSECLYKLDTSKPIVYLSDATFGLMVGYYFNDLSPKAVRQGNMVEQTAIDKAAEVVVSSEWAAGSVISDYHKDPDKVHVLKFGANIDEKDIRPEIFNYNGHLDILFLGVDWVRKGGQTAVDACRWLNEHGVPATLHVVGVKNLDRKVRDLSFVDHIGFLDKNNPDDYHRLVEIIRGCHCMLHPAIAECSAIAFCECTAFGVPVFSQRTGGVGDYVIDGRNGYLLQSGASGADFGSRIKACLESGELERMSVTAQSVYKERLNWNVWAEEMALIIARAMSETDKELP